MTSALRYERALVYKELGEKKRALTEFEKSIPKTPIMRMWLSD